MSVLSIRLCHPMPPTIFPLLLMENDIIKVILTTEQTEVMEYS